MNLTWSFPLKRYPRAIFHRLPNLYKKPDRSQVNRMQGRGAGDVSSDFISIEGRRKKKDLMEKSFTWTPYGYGTPITEIYYPNTKP